MIEVDQPKHRHTLTCGHGWRIVPVSLELLSGILRDGCAATPVNVPGDMEVVGSMTKENIFEATRKPYPSGMVMLVCVSAEWAKSEEIDRRTHEIRTFIPEYRKSD